MPNLHIVQPSGRPYLPLPLPPEHTPRVITPQFVATLGVINNATRALREMGLHVIWSRHQGEMPQVHIRRDHDAVSHGNHVLRGIRRHRLSLDPNHVFAHPGPPALNLTQALEAVSVRSRR